jgi:hypothetical protein
MGSPFAPSLLRIHPTKRLRQIMHQGFKKWRVVRTWDRRDPAVQVRLSMGLLRPTCSSPAAAAAGHGLRLRRDVARAGGEETRGAEQ